MEIRWAVFFTLSAAIALIAYASLVARSAPRGPSLRSGLRRGVRYGLAAATIALVVLLKIQLDPWLGREAPFLLFLGGVMLSAWLGGLGPGLVATAFATLASVVFFEEPAPPGGVAELLRLGAFAAEGALITSLAAALHRARQDADQRLEERRRLEEERARLLAEARAARAEAEAANRVKDRFLAAVSHELRTPIGTILAWLPALRGPAAADGTARRALDAIERSARLQAQLADDLLDLSARVAGKFSLTRGTLDPAVVVQGAMDGFRPGAEHVGVKLEAVLDSDIGLVWGDAERLQQVVGNLLANAIRFTAPSGVVEVRVDRDGSWARLQVSDTGRGIPPDLLPRIFEPFVQDDRTGGQGTGRLGLGLTLVRQIVELHGGSVDAASPGEGGGARFTVRLPLTAARNAAARGPAEESGA